MRPAQISLTRYVVKELQFKVNDAFESLNPWSIAIEDFEVTPKATPRTEDRRNWEVNLRLALNPIPDRNLPYSFSIELAGIIQVDSSVKDENVDRFVHINGTSLVFSAAREIIRSITSYGPSSPILIPTVSFWEPKPSPPVASVEMPPGQAQENPQPAAADK